MVVYKCYQCSTLFPRKIDYERHLMRKTPCNEPKMENGFVIHTCKKCGKDFDRKDNFARHDVTCISLPLKNNKVNNKLALNNLTKIVGDTQTKIVGDTQNKIVGDTQNKIVGDNHHTNQVKAESDSPVIIGNNNTIVKYNLFPFALDGIDCLTTSEKVAIFTSDKNPYEMIIIKVNLDPLKLNHHNISIPDLHSGYGMIFNEHEWITEKISVILEILLNSKEKDLLKIRNEIREFMSEDANKRIKNTMDDFNTTLNPRNPVEIKAKNILTTQLKKYFYNKRGLAKEAIKNTINTTTPEEQNNNNYEGILKDGVTIHELDLHIKTRNQTLKVMREMCNDLITKSINNKNIDDYNLKLINARINTADDVETLNAIMNILFRSAYLNEQITDKNIDDKIIKTNEIVDFYTNRLKNKSRRVK